MSMIVVPPSGMSYPLARMLIENPSFAHMWLVHDTNGVCPDGCDEHGCPKRAELYSNIRCHFTDADVGAYRRGYEDAAKGRAPIFRSTTSRGIVAEIDDSQADEWSDDMRQAYLDGYNAGL